MKIRKTNIEQTKTIIERGGKINILVSPNTVGSSNIVMGVSTLKPNEIVKPHIHDYSEEVFIVLEGSGEIKTKDGETILFGKGDAVCIPKGVAHTIENIGEEEMKVIFAVSPLAPEPALGHREISFVEEK